MSREKQIEEMARELNTATFGVNLHTLGDHLKPETTNKVAEYLYNVGYRKQSVAKWGFKGTAYGCSLCGYGVIAPIYNYCPECGAKMEGGE